jgi:hypothetical protein
MGLHVYLTGKTKRVPCVCAECGHKHSRKETEEFFSASITHNLVPMAQAAGIYEHLWRPDEIGISKASQLIKPLRSGISLMKAEPARFEKLNSDNGWGMYGDFVPWIERYLAACEKHPRADVQFSR